MRMARCHTDRKHSAKNLCKQCYDKHRRPAHVMQEINAREGTKARKRAWYEAKRDANPRFTASKHILRRYGLKDEDLWSMLKRQGGCCRLCLVNLEKVRYHIDHDHKTGKVRGILCANCNTGIGMLTESEFKLQRAIAYLAYHGSLKTFLPGLSTSIHFVDLPLPSRPFQPPS